MKTNELFMPTNELLSLMNKIYQGSELLSNIKIAYEMNAWSTCVELASLYGQLCGCANANEICYWCGNKNEKKVEESIEKGYQAICTLFQQVCEDMLARLGRGEAYNQKLLKAFVRTFMALCKNLHNQPALMDFYPISKDFLLKVIRVPALYDDLMKIFNEVTRVYSLSMYINFMHLRLTYDEVNPELISLILGMFGWGVLDLPVTSADEPGDAAPAE